MYNKKRVLSLLLVLIMLFMPFTTILANAENLNDDVPTIETTLKNMTTKADKFTFDLWAKNPSGNKIPASQVKVTNNDKPVDINWDDLEKTSYTLSLELGTNNVKIKVHYNEKDYIREFTLIREKAEDGDVIGTFTFSMEGFTVGLEYLIEPIQVDIHKGRNAAQELDEILRKNGYKYEHTGTLESSFYLATLLDGTNTVYKTTPKIPDVLKEKLNGNYDEKDYDPEWGLGEFDFNSMSGWMYAVNNVFPNVGFADKYLQDGDVMRVQFTLAYGNDIGGADAMGGGYENNYFPKVNKDELTKKIAEINSSSKKDEYLKINEIRKSYEEAITVLQTVNAVQEDIDKALSDLEKALDNVVKVVSVEEVKDIEVSFSTSKEKVLEELPKGVIVDKPKVRDEESNFKFDKETGTITGYYGDGGDIIIPNEIDGVKVTTIGSSAFMRKKITSVDIPDTVTTIKYQAFAFNSLTSVEIPDSVTEIVGEAFSHNRLTTVKLPKNIKEISKEMFYGNKLTEVSIPKSVVNIEDGAFKTNELESINIHEGIKNIGKNAFRENNLTSVTIPESVKTIGIFTFAENKLSSLEILEGTESIGRGAFSGNQLTSIEIPESVTNIEMWAFQENELTEGSVIINNFKENVNIGKDAFPEGVNPIFIKEKEEIGIVNIEEVEDIEVDYGTNKEEVISILPNKLKLNLSNGDNVEVDVKWINEAYDGNKSGKYIFKGSYDLPEAVTGDRPKVIIKVTVKEELEPKVDKIELEKILKEAGNINLEGKAEESIKVLEKAIRTGKKILNKEKVSQEEVDEAVVNIKSAINNLEDEEKPKPDPKPDPKPKPEVDKTKLQQIIGESQKLDLKGKTEESIKRLQEAIEKGKEILINEEVAQKEVDEAVENIENSVKNLEDKKESKSSKIQKPEKPTKPQEPEKVDTTNKTGKTELPKTGETSNILISIFGSTLLLVGIGLYIYKMRKSSLVEK